MADKELTPAQAEAVRRLLEEARHDQAMPDVVARHLDDVVAELAADRANAAAAEPSDTNVVPFRQRRWPRVLVAAAAVSALGLGITQVLDGVGAGSGDDSGGVNADRAVVDSDQFGPGTDDGGAPGEAPRDPGPQATSGDGLVAEENRDATDKWLGRYIELKGVAASTAIDSLGSTIERLEPLPRREMRGTLRLLADRMFQSATKHNAGGYDLLANRRAMTRSAYDAPIAPQACGPIYTVVGGRATYARYDHKLALVLFHPEVNGAQLVELYVCSGATPRRSVERVTLWDGE